MANSNRFLEKEQFWRLVLNEQVSMDPKFYAVSEPSYYA